MAGLPGTNGAADGTGAAARFGYPVAIATDTAGNAYVADYMNFTIRKVTPTGVVTTLAGSAGNYGNVNGTGSAARFSCVSGIAIDSQGNLFVTDRGNNVIRKITPSGVVTTFAGPGPYYYTDGTGSAASFGDPLGITIDSSDILYVCDSGYSSIRKITPSAVVTTWVGPGAAGTNGSADGTGAAARFSNPTSLCIDLAGNVYVADTQNSTIRKITPAGVVTTLAGFAGVTGTADGTGSSARFFQPWGITTDAWGNMVVVDTYNFTFRSVTPAGIVATIGGLAGANGSADGTGANAHFAYPFGAFMAADGSFAIVDSNNYTVRRATTVGATQMPVITSALTANGTMGVPFSYSITATGSPTSYNALGLPAGLAINTVSGVISGTPAGTGSTVVTLYATNVYGSGGAPVTIAIGGPPPVITSSTSAGGRVGSAFTYQITATNAPTTYNFSNVPPGSWNYSTATGLLTGTPVAIGTTSMTIYATNNGGTGSTVVTVVIAAALPPQTDTTNQNQLNIHIPHPL